MAGQAFGVTFVGHNRRLHIIVLGSDKPYTTLCGRTTHQPQIGAAPFDADKLAALRGDRGVYCRICVDLAAVRAGLA